MLDQSALNYKETCAVVVVVVVVVVAVLYIFNFLKLFILLFYTLLTNSGHYPRILALASGLDPGLKVDLE